MHLKTMFVILAISTLFACSSGKGSREVKIVPGETEILKLSVTQMEQKISLQPREISYLTLLADYMNKHEGSKLEVYVYTNDSKDPLMGQRLTSAATRLITQFLESKGIDMRRIQSKYYSDERTFPTRLTQKKFRVFVELTLEEK